MKYFLDTEFIEGTQKKLFGKSKPTIDLISIGIVSEDNREYYAISKDFNLKEAWNRYDLSYEIVDSGRDKQYVKRYWIRENVLKPLYEDLWKSKSNLQNIHRVTREFNYSNFKKLIKLYGKSNKKIAKEVKDFVYAVKDLESFPTHKEAIDVMDIQFYTYYGAYDWVVFCWLFGRMIDLPKGFPMYSRDLKQMLDEKGGSVLKKDSAFPKQQNEHNALDDAKWNKDLYTFLTKNT